MKHFDELRTNVTKLITKFNDLNVENKLLQDKIDYIEKDLSFLEDKHHDYPDVLLKNKKLLSEREKLAQKVDLALKKLENIKV